MNKGHKEGILSRELRAIVKVSKDRKVEVEMASERAGVKFMKVWQERSWHQAVFFIVKEQPHAN